MSLNLLCAHLFPFTTVHDIGLTGHMAIWLYFDLLLPHIHKTTGFLLLATWLYLDLPPIWLYLDLLATWSPVLGLTTHRAVFGLTSHMAVSGLTHLHLEYEQLGLQQDSEMITSQCTCTYRQLTQKLLVGQFSNFPRPVCFYLQAHLYQMFCCPIQLGSLGAFTLSRLSCFLFFFTHMYAKSMVLGYMCYPQLGFQGLVSFCAIGAGHRTPAF